MKKNKTIIATILLIIIIGTAIAATSKSYYNLEKDVCFNTLKEYTNQLAYEIKINVYNDREQLKLISNIIDNYDSIHSQEVVEILSSYSGQGMMSHLEILLPDNTILKSDGQRVNAIGFPFQEEAVKGAHMSARMIDPVDGKKILHSYVPIVKNHEIVAILYGVIDLEVLPQLFSVDIFDQNTQIYLIEGKNGDFLLDTWHKDLEKVDNFFERQTKKGYYIEKVSFLEYDMEKFSKNYHINKEMMKLYAAQNIMIVPVMGRNGELTGILGAYNMKHHWQNTAQLECLTLSFAMAINNMDVYLTIKKMGTIDSLTGLFNRNSYLAALEDTDLQNVHSLACVYIDVNGLHELNNHLGHEAGDIMLRWIANEIKSTFAIDRAYRIGGDEFVVFCFDQSKKEIQNKASTVKQTAKNKNYYLSIGVEWQDDELDLQKMVKGAEERMQQDKRKYYREKGDERKIREMNRHLEKMISEKQDADAFLSVIAEILRASILLI